jgi:hypothetical protein
MQTFLSENNVDHKMADVMDRTPEPLRKVA